MSGCRGVGGCEEGGGYGPLAPLNPLLILQPVIFPSMNMILLKYHTSAENVLDTLSYKVRRLSYMEGVWICYTDRPRVHFRFNTTMFF